MNKAAKRRILLMVMAFVICAGVLALTNLNREAMEPEAYEYYIEKFLEESGMENAVTAIYLRYRMFDTLFEALLLASAVSAVAYFAADWEKEGGVKDE